MMKYAVVANYYSCVTHIGLLVILILMKIYFHVFGFLTAETSKSMIAVVTPCSLKRIRYFEGTYRLHLQGLYRDCRPILLLLTLRL
jgi:hypothetical protein